LKKMLQSFKSSKDKNKGEFKTPPSLRFVNWRLSWQTGLRLSLCWSTVELQAVKMENIELKSRLAERADVSHQTFRLFFDYWLDNAKFLMSHRGDLGANGWIIIPSFIMPFFTTLNLKTFANHFKRTDWVSLTIGNPNFNWL
jgi:hypothetical protein